MYCIVTIHNNCYRIEWSNLIIKNLIMFLKTVCNLSNIYINLYTYKYNNSCVQGRKKRRYYIKKIGLNPYIIYYCLHCSRYVFILYPTIFFSTRGQFHPRTYLVDDLFLHVMCIMKIATFEVNFYNNLLCPIAVKMLRSFHRICYFINLEFMVK